MEKITLILISIFLFSACNKSAQNKYVENSNNTQDMANGTSNEKAYDAMVPEEDLAQKEFCDSEWVKNNFPDKYWEGKNNNDYYITYDCLLLSKKENIAVIVQQKAGSDSSEYPEFFNLYITLVDSKNYKILDRYYDQDRIDIEAQTTYLKGPEKLKNFPQAFIVPSITESTSTLVEFPKWANISVNIYTYTPVKKIKKLLHGLPLEFNYYVYREKNEFYEKCIGVSYHLIGEIQALDSKTNGLNDLQIIYNEKNEEYVAVENKKSPDDSNCDFKTVRNYPVKTFILKFNGQGYPLPAIDQYESYSYKYYDKYYDDFLDKYD